MPKDGVLKLLLEHTDGYISGATLAEQLSVSRTAVWKDIAALREEGYPIDSVTNRGYRLSSQSDILSVAGVEKYLTTQGLQLEVYPTVSSTNTLLKQRGAEGAPEGLAIVAGQQTEGRGRMGRSFYSPPDSGVYLSVLLRPESSAEVATNITACAAVAVAEAIETLSGQETQIKWVNDVLIQGKKVCGILTEASVDCESGMMNYAIVGIGVNTGPPAGEFPEELRETAGVVFPAEGIPELRCQVAAAILDRLMYYYRHLAEKRYFAAYKARSIVLGRDVQLLAPGRAPVPAKVLALDQDFALLVAYPDGSTGRVNSGEVSLRFS